MAIVHTSGFISVVLGSKETSLIVGIVPIALQNSSLADRLRSRERAEDQGIDHSMPTGQNIHVLLLFLTTRHPYVPPL
jgi:hypothetical protein